MPGNWLLDLPGSRLAGMAGPLSRLRNHSRDNRVHGVGGGGRVTTRPTFNPTGSNREPRDPPGPRCVIGEPLAAGMHPAMCVYVSIYGVTYMFIFGSIYNIQCICSMSECTANVSVLLFNKHSKTIVGNYTVAQDSNMYKNCYAFCCSILV